MGAPLIGPSAQIIPPIGHREVAKPSGHSWGEGWVRVGKEATFHAATSTLRMRGQNLDQRNRRDTEADFMAALEAEPRARRAFEEASEPYRSGLIALVREAGDREYRSQRIALVIKTLLQHKSR